LVLGLAVAVRLGYVVSSLVWDIGALGFIALSAASGYVLGQAREPDLARLLLSLDLALGTGELLCSLHEIRSRGGPRPLRDRIEQKLSQMSLPWRRTLRPGWRDGVAWVCGAVLMALVILLSSALPVPDAVLSAAVPERGAAADSSVAARSASSGDAAIPASSVRADPAPGEAPEPLVDTLSKILPAPPSRGLLGGELVSDAGEPGAVPSEGDVDPLSELLSSIMGRAQANPRQRLALTDDEKQTLRDLLESMPGSSLRDSLSSLLDAEPGDELRDRLAESQQILKSVRADEQGPGNAQTENAPGDRATTTPNDESDAVDWIPEARSPSGQTSRPGEGERAAGQNAGEPGGRGDSAPASDEGGSAAGAPGKASPSVRPQGVGLVPEDLMGSLGSEGALRRFLTKGIPFEPPAFERGATPVLTLDYESLRALLEARALAPEIRDVVQVYFEQLTTGGP